MQQRIAPIFAAAAETATHIKTKPGSKSSCLFYLHEFFDDSIATISLFLDLFYPLDVFWLMHFSVVPIFLNIFSLYTTREAVDYSILGYRVLQQSSLLFRLRYESLVSKGYS